MAIQIIPLVAAIVGGAVTIGTGVYVYNNYQENKEAEKSAMVEPQKLLQDQAKPEINIEKPKLPEFGLLRVERDGSVVIAGTAPGNSPVEIVQGDQVLGKSKAESNGDFVVIFENPLKPGNYELHIRSISKDGSTLLSEEAGIVSLPDDGSEHLAMVSKPAGPSKLIQVSKLEDEPQKQVIKGDRPKKVEETPAAEKKEAKQEPVKSEVVAEKKEATQVKTAEEQAPVKEPEATEKKVAAVEEKPVEQKSAEEQPVEKQQAEPVKVAEAGDAKQEQKVETAKAEDVPTKPVDPEGKQEQIEIAALDNSGNKQTAERSLKASESKKEVSEKRPEAKEVVKKEAEAIEVKEMASVTPEKIEEKKPEPKQLQPVFLEAVEVEDSKIFVAGTGEPDHVVNVYINDKYIGSAKVNARGTFLLESSSTLDFGNHVVRADMLGYETSKVAARAEVPLIHEQPEEQKQIVVAEAKKVEESPVKEEVKEPVKEAEQKVVETAETKVSEPAKPVEQAKVEQPKEMQKAAEDKKPEVKKEELQVAKLEDKQPEKELTRKLTRSEPTKTEVKSEEVKSEPKEASRKVVVEEVKEPVKVPEKKEEPVQVVKEQTPAEQPKQVITENKTPPVPASDNNNDQKVAALKEDKVAKAPRRVIRTGSSVIIRRGDNLWRISRRILGRGIRYSTIYKANQDQIRNPHLIFPGQIFKVPEKMVDVNQAENS